MFIIIFEEMALDVNLQYNKKDVVDGFMDSGFQQWKPLIADKAMVFIV